MISDFRKQEYFCKTGWTRRAKQAAVFRGAARRAETQQAPPPAFILFLRVFERREARTIRGQRDHAIYRKAASPEPRGSRDTAMDDPIARTVGALLIGPDGKVLLGLRAPSKKVWP